MALVACTAVVSVTAAAATVLRTAPRPPGPTQVSAYREWLEVLPVDVGALTDLGTGSLYVVPDRYQPNLGVVTFSAQVLFPDAVVRLYAQPYPFKKAPVLVKSVTVPMYAVPPAFTMRPTVTTRYQLKLFSAAAVRTPAQISPVYTVYVRPSIKLPGLT
jgi:hypothetical protein